MAASRNTLYCDLVFGSFHRLIAIWLAAAMLCVAVPTAMAVSPGDCATTMAEHAVGFDSAESHHDDIEQHAGCVISSCCLSALNLEAAKTVVEPTSSKTQHFPFPQAVFAEVILEKESPPII